ncbi:hypothetical protein GCK32_002217, partial [Trichostrongylus colubriformis]
SPQPLSRISPIIESIRTDVHHPHRPVKFRQNWFLNDSFQMGCSPGSRLLSLWWWYVETDSLATEHELKRLGEHKYSAVDNSWLDELCMKRWWEYVVTWCPMWLAPNLITLIGLIINLITVLVLSSFSYSATEPAPSWAYAQAALGLFLYQTLDAIDGKQARRTGSSSPLGELFDHGCDSMTQGSFG